MIKFEISNELRKKLFFRKMFIRKKFLDIIEHDYVSNIEHSNYIVNDGKYNYFICVHKCNIVIIGRISDKNNIKYDRMMFNAREITLNKNFYANKNLTTMYKVHGGSFKIAQNMLKVDEALEIFFILGGKI